MKRFAAGLVATLCLGGGAFAQAPIGSYTQPQVNPHPTTSPYLNLNRGANNTATNYFGVVRPQFDNQQAIQNLQQQQYQGNQGTMGGPAGPVAAEEIAPTGHRMGGFFNYSHYYPLFSTGGGGVGAGVGTPGVAGPGYGGAGFAGPGGNFATGYGQVGYGFIR